MPLPMQEGGNMCEKMKYASVLCAIVLVSFAGCPATSGAVGAWRFQFDGPCTGGISAVTGLFVYANGTVELFDIGAPVPGTWTLAGTTFNMTLNPPGDPSVFYQATLAGNTLIDGTFVGTGFSGCWTALRPQF